MKNDTIEKNIIESLVKNKMKENVTKYDLSEKLFFIKLKDKGIEALKSEAIKNGCNLS